MRALEPHLVAVLLALPIALVFGCSTEEEGSETRSSWSYRLSLATAPASYGSTFAVGDRVPLEAVAIHTTTTCNLDSSGCDAEECESWSSEHQLGVDSVFTSREDCAVNDRLEVSCSSGGEVTVHARLPDQTTVETTLRFAEVAELKLFTEPFADAGLNYASLTGAWLDWNLSARSAAGEAIYLVESTIRWSSNVTQLDAGSIAVQLHAAGVAELSVSGGGLARRERVRVAAPEEVVKIELAPIAPRDQGWVDADRVQLPDAARLDALSLDLRAPHQDLVIVLTLADGSIALGGAALATVEPPYLAEVTHSGSLSQPVEQRASHPRFSLSPRGAGTGSLTVAVGPTLRRFELQVVDSPAVAAGGAGGEGGTNELGGAPSTPDASSGRGGAPDEP